MKLEWKQGLIDDHKLICNGFVCFEIWVDKQREEIHIQNFIPNKLKKGFAGPQSIEFDFDQLEAAKKTCEEFCKRFAKAFAKSK